MNKTLQALKYGYVKFRVNDKTFYTYNKALKYSNSLMGKVNQSFDGYNLKKKKWESFRIETFNMTPFMNIESEYENKMYEKYYHAIAQI